MKKTKHRILAILLAAALALAFTACGDKDEAGGTSASAPPASETPTAGANASETAAEDYDWAVDRPLEISLVGDSCELHFFAAEYLGLFEEAGYEVNWILNGPSVDSKAILASGKIDITEGVLDSWLKPIEQGLDIRFTIGLEQGCMGTVVLADSPYQSIADLKGQKIGGMGTVGSGTHNYLYRVILKEGLDPVTDYEWVGLEQAAALQALENKDVEAIVLPDSISYEKVKNGTYRYITRMPLDEVLNDQTCCFLMFSPQFADKYPGATKKITEILYEASVYIQDEQNKKDVIKYAFDEGLIIMGTYEDTIELLEPFRWEPGGQIAEDTFRSAFAAFQASGFIDEGVDVDKFLEKSFINYEEFYETTWEPDNPQG
jgi:NitT/TauT family transport system substrate-binding protein